MLKTGLPARLQGPYRRNWCPCLLTVTIWSLVMTWNQASMVVQSFLHVWPYRLMPSILEYQLLPCRLIPEYWMILLEKCKTYTKVAILQVRSTIRADTWTYIILFLFIGISQKPDLTLTGTSLAPFSQQQKSSIAMYLEKSENTWDLRIFLMFLNFSLSSVILGTSL